MDEDSFVLGKKTENTGVQKRMNQQFTQDEPEKDHYFLNHTEYDNQYQLAVALTKDIILKNYLYHLTENKVYSDKGSTNLNEIRIFKITEMVYQNQEYSSYKLAAVFNSVQNLDCSIAVIADSNGEKTEFYMGIRTDDTKFDAESLKNILKGALTGQFPGVQTEDLSGAEKKQLLKGITSDNIAAVSCVANNKNANFTSNENFIQGLEKLVFAMRGKKYTAVILAKSIKPDELQKIRAEYETTYTQLSSMANRQISYGYNYSENVSSSVQMSDSTGSSWAVNVAEQQGKSISESYAVSKPDQEAVRKKAIAGSIASLLGMGVAAAFPTGGVSIAAAGVLGALNTAVAMIPVPTETKSVSDSINHSITEGVTAGKNRNSTLSATSSEGKNIGTNQGIQRTVQNKGILDMMERIDKQLKRIDECESLGMWESAAYFFADSLTTAEMAAGTYKAIIAGENTGVQTAALNLWGGESQKSKRSVLHQYITNLRHPKFQYPELKAPVSAGAVVSSNELAIQMGLPRKSVCGFPVTEHAEFGREVVKRIRRDKNDDINAGQNLKEHRGSDGSFHFSVQESEEETKKKREAMKRNRSVSIGKVYSMGECTTLDVPLSCQRLTEHTFITGSTGAGKSNTTCQILHQLQEMSSSEKIHFLVIEPAKGEYAKDFPEADVYDANPLEKTTNLLRLNPFYFPENIHILHHLDRLVEIFNVCWPMYAAMPAILKKAMHNAYEASGWNMLESRNIYNYRIFPDFSDVLREIRKVVDESDYSSDNKSDYTGSLVTRVESLTTGIFGMVFRQNGISDQDLFDKNVIVDLSSIGSSETKSMIMGILVLKLQEYRMSQRIEANSALRHVTVLEEAHHLLKRTSTEQNTESSNLLGKSVEMLTNAIAEMRTYGEGFIIADQAPGLLDMAVIRNTNTKIIHRLPDYSDRELVGRAAGLNEEQVKELAKLEQGVAVIRQSDWLDSVLCKVDKYQSSGTPSKTIRKKVSFPEEEIKYMLFTFILCRCVWEGFDDIKEEVVNSELSGIAKADFFILLQSTEQEWEENTQRLLYDVFHAENVCRILKKNEITEEWVNDAVAAIFSPYLKEYDEEDYEKTIKAVLDEDKRRRHQLLTRRLFL